MIAQGVNATGTDQPATVANVSKRTLYTHFAGKEDLVQACLSGLEDGLLPPEVVPGEPCPDPRGSSWRSSTGARGRWTARCAAAPS